MASRNEAREHEARGKPYHKKHEICCVVPLPLSLFQGSVSFRSTIVRFGMTNRSVKDCRVGRTRPPRNDKFGRFCGEMKRFTEQKVSNFSGAIPRKKQPQKTAKIENVRFQTKTSQFSCHCEERSDVAIYKPKVWHSVAKHGSTKQKSQKTRESLRRFASSFFISGFCFVPLNHSSLRNDKSFRLRLPRRAHAPSSQ